MGKNQNQQPIPFRVNDPSVPSVGQPFEVSGFTPVVMCKCTCDPANVPFLLNGVQHAMQCHRCQRLFFIGALMYDRNSGNTNIQIGVQMPNVGGMQ